MKINTVNIIPSPILSRLLFLRNMLRLSKNLLNKTNTRKNLSSLISLKKRADENIAGKIKSNGMAAIRSIQLLFCFKNTFLGFDRYKLMQNSPKRIKHTIKSKIYKAHAISEGSSKQIKSKMQTISIRTNMFNINHAIYLALYSLPLNFKISPQALFEHPI